MAYTQEYRQKIEARLAQVLPIQTKAMFGGVGIYGEGLFFALIAEDALYFKVDDTNRPDFEEAGMTPFHPYDSPRPMNYWELPSAVLADDEELKAWIDKALRIAEKQAAKKLRKKKL
jgi:DNA transformation protein